MVLVMATSGVKGVEKGRGDSMSGGVWAIPSFRSPRQQPDRSEHDKRASCDDLARPNGTCTLPSPFKFLHLSFLPDI